jgi:hypothetical protein
LDLLGMPVSVLILIGVGALVGLAALAAVLFLLLSDRDHDNKGRRE